MSRTLTCVFIMLATFLSIDHATAATTRCRTDCPDPDPGPGPTPGPTPPPTTYQYEARNTGSIGNSTLGAQYSAGLLVYTTSDGASLRVRGSASGTATMLGYTFASLASVSGVVTASNVFQVQSTMFAAGQQVFDFSTVYNSPIADVAFTGHYAHEFWHYSRNWMFLGIGVTIQLALDGGADLTGSAMAQPLYATANLNPRLFIDAGGALSASFLWLNVGSLYGSIHLLEAKLSGTGVLDARALPAGGRIAYSVAGSANLCTVGGEIGGCIIGLTCGTLVSWDSVCPGALALSGQRSGTF